MERIRILSLAVGAIVLASLMFITPVSALDQENSRLSEIPVPADMEISKVAWNENTYSYAIGIGRNASSNTAAIFRYEPEKGWKEIHKESSTEPVYYDIAYDTCSNNDTFIVVGDWSGESMVYLIYEADTEVPSIVNLGNPPPGAGYTGVCFDRYTGPEGTIVAVGTPYKGSEGIIAWHNMSKDGDIWSKFVLKTGIVLKDVTTNQDPEHPVIVAVGYDNSTGSAVAYATDYSDIYALNVPPEAAEFNAIKWMRGEPDGYALVVGTDKAGNGKIWKMYDITRAIYISYYDATPGRESLKYAFYDGYGWRITTVDDSPYAGYYTSIALDSHGNPHISYWDGGSTYLKHAYFENGQWYIETVDSSGNVGQYSSIFIDKNTDDIYISYYDSTNGDLKYAMYDGTSWNIQVVDSTGDVGKYTSISVDDGNFFQPAISYFDVTNEDLKCAYYDPTSGWEIWTVDSVGSTGYYTTISTEVSGTLEIIYYDQTGNAIKDATYSYADVSWAVRTIKSGVYVTHLSVTGGGTRAMKDISYTNSSGTNYFEYTSYGDAMPVVGIDPDGTVDCSIASDSSDMYISYYDSVNYDLRLGYYNGSAWKNILVDADGNVGKYSSIAIGAFARYSPVKTKETADISFRDIDWNVDNSFAVVVGDKGSIFVHYNATYYAYNWSDPSILSDFSGVAVKPPGSAGYAIAVSPAGVTKISYQVYNTDTEIRARAILPNINEINITDSSGNCLLNHQIDVQSPITFFINASYENGWDQVGGIDIYAWYDFGSEGTQYNDTKGANINFHLHYTPDYGNINQGTWELLWPNRGEVELLGWYQTFKDNNNFIGTPGVADPTDYFLLYVNISLGPQVRYANGDGGFPLNASPSLNQSDPSIAFDNKFSWNFNVTIYDISNVNTNDVKYDEFGVYAYTEIAVTNSPSGSGAPGETIELSPYSHVGVRANRNYTVTVSIGDLENATGARRITRDNVEIRNPDANNDTSISDIAYWTSFPSSGGALTVWGAGGNLIDPLDNGTCSVGTRAGYDIDLDYTTILWRITIPPSTPEDEYSSVITFEITY